MWEANSPLDRVTPMGSFMGRLARALRMVLVHRCHSVLFLARTRQTEEETYSSESDKSVTVSSLFRDGHPVNQSNCICSLKWATFASRFSKGTTPIKSFPEVQERSQKLLEVHRRAQNGGFITSR